MSYEYCSAVSWDTRVEAASTFDRSRSTCAVFHTIVILVKVTSMNFHQFLDSLKVQSFFSKRVCCKWREPPQNDGSIRLKMSSTWSHLACPVKVLKALVSHGGLLCRRRGLEMLFPKTGAILEWCWIFWWTILVLQIDFVVSFPVLFKYIIYILSN